MPDSFASACGCSGPILVRVDHNGNSFELQLHQPFVRLGSARGNDIQLNDPEIAPRQLYIQMIDGYLFVVNLAPEVPLVCLDRHGPAGWVRPGDPVRVGSVSVVVVAVEVAQGRAEDVPGNPLSAKNPYSTGYSLQPIQKGVSSARLLYQDRRLLLIGRSPPAKVLIDDPTVNAVHAALLQTVAGLWLVNLSTSDRTLVNGRPVNETRLGHGDIVTVGPYDIRVWLPTAAVAPAGALQGQATQGWSQIDGVMLDQIEQYQRQTFEQFRMVLAATMQMVGDVMNDHRQFVRDELGRMERLLQERPAPGARPRSGAARPAGHQPPALPSAEPIDLKVAGAPPRAARPPAGPPGPTAPPTSEQQLHAWLEGQLGALENEQQTTWSRLMGKLKGQP